MELLPMTMQQVELMTVFLEYLATTGRSILVAIVIGSGISSCIAGAVIAHKNGIL